MISTSTTDPQNIKEVGGDIPTYDSSPIITPKKRKQVDGDVAMNDSSTFQRTLPLDSSPSITPEKRKEGPETDSSFAETPTKITRRRRLPRASGSRSKKRKQRLSLTTSSQYEGTTQTTTKKRPRRLLGKLTPYLIDLNAGQDVVDIIYTISQPFPHLTLSIISAIGPISDIALLTPNGVERKKGEFEILSISVRRLTGDDGRHCHAKAVCSVSWIDDKGIVYASTSVNSLIAAGPFKIIMAYFNTDNAKKAGVRISGSPAAAARNGDSDSKMLVEGQTSRHLPTLNIFPNRRVVDRKIFPIEATPLQMIAAISDPAKEYCAKVIEEAASRMLVEEQTSFLPPTSKFLPTTPSVADGDINMSTSTTSTSNDQDMKSPSEGNT